MWCRYCRSTGHSFEAHYDIAAPLDPDHQDSQCRAATFCNTENGNWRGFPVAEMVHCGFYFTGARDVLKCFWCDERFENWQVDHEPLERHFRKSIRCKYVAQLVQSTKFCLFCSRWILVPTKSFVGHEKRCLQLAIATRVESVPRNPRMADVEFRKKSFEFFSQNPKRKLVEYGFYFTGRDVLCFHCGGSVNEGVEHPLHTHSAQHPDCTFAKNALKQKEEEEFATMQEESARLATFDSVWTRDTNPRILARLGFFYLKKTDCFQCAYCRAVIDARVSNYVGFHEHVSPRCLFVAAWKLGNNPTRVEWVDPAKRLKSLREGDVENATDMAKSGFFYTGYYVRCFWCRFQFSSLEELDDAFEDHVRESPDCIFAKNAQFEAKRQERSKCEICCINERKILFMKCGHFMCCESCAGRLNKCPTCRSVIVGRIKVYES